jgi:tripartite-type tricarboxylate transporter receptor subunit TctC
MLASTGSARSPAAPDLPTLREGALPGCEVVNWVGILAPAATPEPVVARANAAVVQALETPEVRRLFEEHGMEPVAGSPSLFAAHLRAEIERWGRFVEANRAAFPTLQ